MKYVNEGGTMKVVLAADTAAHVGILVGDKVVVTTKAGKAGETVICLTGGQYEADASAAIAQGKNVKFNNGTKQWSVAAPDAGGETPGDPIHGFSMSAAVDGKFRVKIG